MKAFSGKHYPLCPHFSHTCIPTMAHTPSHIPTYTLTESHLHIHPHMHSHPHMHFHTPSHALPHPQMHSHTPSHALPQPSHAPSHALPHTLTCTLTCTPTLRFSHALSHMHSHTPSLPHISTYHDALSVFSSTPRCSIALNLRVRGNGTLAVCPGVRGNVNVLVTQMAYTTPHHTITTPITITTPSLSPHPSGQHCLHPPYPTTTTAHTYKT